MNNTQIQELYNELNNELLNSDINEICNICKLPTKKHDRITLKCNHFYHINCINVSNRTIHISCPYCSKKNNIEKLTCMYINNNLKSYKNDLCHNKEYQLQLKKKISELETKKNKLQNIINNNSNKKNIDIEQKNIDIEQKNIDIEQKNIDIEQKNINDIKEKILNFSNKYHCKRCTISDSKYCGIHIKKIQQNIEKNNNILKYKTNKEDLIETIKSLEIILNTNSEEVHICNYKKKNNLLCSNKTKNNFIYCGIHMKKIKKDINDNNKNLIDLEIDNLSLNDTIKELSQSIY